MTRTLVSLILCASVAAQGKPTPPQTAAERLVAGLADDATWRATAARLVLMRERAAGPLAAALTEAGKRRDNRVARRILTVLDRLGMDGAAATDALWNSIEFLDVENAGLALRVVPRIRAVGGDPPQERIAQFEWWRAGSDKFSRHVRSYLGPALRRLGAKHRLKADLTVEQLLLQAATPNSESAFAVVQLLGARGEAAKVALPLLAEQLQAAYGRRLEVHAQQDLDELGRDIADAILHIDPRAPQAALAYGYLLQRDRLRGIRLHAARELMLLGPHVQGAAKFLLDFLRKAPEDTELVCAVINAVTMLGWRAEWAAPALETLAKVEDEKVARRAASALQRIKKGGKER